MAAPGSQPAVPIEVHRLHVTFDVLQPVSLPGYRGPMLRAALIDALRDRFCVLNGAKEIRTCGQEPSCQICGIVATNDAANTRGRDTARPYALRPPLDNHPNLTCGDTLALDIVLFGTAARYIPYLVLALTGISRIGPGHGAAGDRQLALHEIWAVNDLSGEAHRVHGVKQPQIILPHVPMTSQQIYAAAADMPQTTVMLHIQTPLRLVSDGALVHRLNFASLIRRIIGRLADLSSAYGITPLSGDFVPLLEAADQIKITQDATRWLDVASHSSRLQRSTPIGGLVGTIGFTGNLAPFLPFLIWGELVQLGKDTTKGNGLYQIITR
jgi:hypothetical protein